jgi:hypothetical protein
MAARKKRLREQAKTFHHEAEAHERDAGSIPRQPGALGREEDAGIP